MKKLLEMFVLFILFIVIVLPEIVYCSLLKARDWLEENRR